MKTAIGTAARGCPRTYPPLKSACTGVARAIAAMAREGAANKNACSNLTSPPKRIARRQSGAEWWGGEKLAETLGIGSSKDAFNRMATGSPAIAIERTVSFTRELINNGLLPANALAELALSPGHARAMMPFAPLFPELRALGEFVEPSAELAQRVDKCADDYRAAIAEQNSIEQEERARVRQARVNAVAALLGLQGALRHPEEPEDQEVLENVVVALAELGSVLDSVTGATWEVESSPRQEVAALALDVGLAAGTDGQPAFPNLFRWIELNAFDGRPEREQIVEQFCRRVLDRWGRDPRLVAPGGGADELPCAFWRVLDLGSNLAGLSQPAKRFLEKVTSTGGIHGVKFLLLMALAENWYFGDERAQCEQTDFEDRLDAIRTWAGSKLLQVEADYRDKGNQTRNCELPKRQAPPMPTAAQVKRLVKELVRLDVRPRLEMNLDLPEVWFP